MKNLIFSLFTFFTTIAVAQKPGVVISDKTGWHKIAETTVDFSKDRDEIMVIGADRFESIKFKVSDAAINLQDLEIHVEGGERQDVQVRTPIQAGGESREIQVKGGERDLNKVVFVYNTIDKRDGEKARVELWGYKSNVNKNVKTEDKTKKEME